MSEQMHQIVIVGGGAGGLELATKLGKTIGKQKKARVILVDKNLTHLWKPLLHQVAAGALDSHSDELNYRAQAAANHFEFHLGRLEFLNREKKRIYLAPIEDEEKNLVVPQRQLAYDTLVLAVGSETNDFNTYGADKHCLFLDSRVQAERFHTQLLNQYLRANAIIEATPDDSIMLNVAIIGAGATGVELAAELKSAGQQLTNYGLHRIKPERLNITLIEASDRVLAGLPPRISIAVKQELEHIGVTVLTGERVVEVEKNGIKLHSEKFIPAELKVWAAGIKAPDFLAKLPGLETNNINQIKVKQTLQSEQDESIFAFGDCAFCPQENLARGVPPRAQSAHQQASLLSKSLPAYLFKNKALIPYIYRDRGSLISLAKYSAVGNLMGSLVGKSFLIEGKIAKIMYISLYRMHQMALYGFVKTALFMLNDLIRRAIKPRLKLH